MNLSAQVVIARAQALTRHTARERRRTLEAELRDYQSESDLRDFEAILDRYPDHATAELRDILVSQARLRDEARRQRRWPAMYGYYSGR